MPKTFNIAKVDTIGKKSDYKKAVHSARSAVYTILGLSFIVFVAIAAIAISNEGLYNFISTLKSVNIQLYALSLVIIFTSYTIRYPKWSMYLKKLGVRLPFSKNYIIYMSMYSMDMTPGRWGRAIVSYTINMLTKVRFAKTFPAVVADIFTDFLGFAVITNAMAIVVGKFVLLSFLITFLLIVPFFFIYVQRPFDYVKTKFKMFRKKFRFLKRLDIIFYTATLYFKHNKKLRGTTFLYSMIFTIPSMLLNGMAFYITILAFGVPLSPTLIPTVLFIFTFSLVLGMISGIPGTLGITDAAMISQLQLFFPATITLGLAAAITIFFRIASVWFVQGFGFVSLLYTMKYWKD